MAVHLEAPRDVGKHLGGALAHRAQLGATAGFAHARRHVHDVATRQLGRQLAALLFLGLRSRGGLCLRLGGLRRQCCGLGFRRLGLLQGQLELGDDALDALGARAELLTAELGDLGLELLDRQLRHDKAVLRRGQLAVSGQQLGILRDQPLLQLGDVVGQLIGREWHAPDLSASCGAAAESRGRSPQIIQPTSAATSVAAPSTPVLPQASKAAPASV